MIINDPQTTTPPIAVMMNDSELDIFLARLSASCRKDNVPCISEQTASYLRALLRENHPSHVLEIGTCFGYSSLLMARELREWGGEVTTLEFSEPSYERARTNLKETGFERHVHVLYGDALSLLPSLPNARFDFAFIDGEKRSTLAFVQGAWPKLRVGSKIVVDDVLKYRDKMADFWDWVEQQGLPHHIVPLDKDDGVMILGKSY